MIFPYTYYSEATDESINILVGKPYGFIEKIRMGGTGSHRFMVIEVSTAIKNLLFSHQDIIYVNLEIRPLGILVLFSHGIRNAAWAIPYKELKILKTDVVEILGKQNSVKLAYSTIHIKILNKIENYRNKFISRLT